MPKACSLREKWEAGTKQWRGVGDRGEKGSLPGSIVFSVLHCTLYTLTYIYQLVDCFSAQALDLVHCCILST